MHEFAHVHRVRSVLLKILVYPMEFLFHQSSFPSHTSTNRRNSLKIKQRSSDVKFPPSVALSNRPRLLVSLPASSHTSWYSDMKQGPEFVVCAIHKLYYHKIAHRFRRQAVYSLRFDAFWAHVNTYRSCSDKSVCIQLKNVAKNI